MKIAFLHTPNFFTSELLKRFRTALAHHEVVEWIGGKDAPAFDFDVLLAMGYVGRALLQSQPKLKFIQTASDGYEEVDIEAASELGIWVSYAPADLTGNATSVAEFAVLLLLGAARHLGEAFTSPRGDSVRPPTLSLALNGKTVCIVGLGTIGQQLVEPSVCATKIGVSVNEGVVELDGHVGSLYEKWAAERAALRVVDVTSVASEIIVDLPFESERTDEDIASAAGNHLNWNSQVPDTIKLKVSKGWITLQGTAEWQYQKEEAARAVRSLRGVKAVLNEIELKPTVSTTGVKIKIEDALKRDAQIEAKDITVETSGNMVTLRGHVHTWNEREDAEHAAFSAPGVGSVSNLLTVSY